MLKPNKINLAARLREDSVPERGAEGRRRMRQLIPLCAIIFITLAVELVYFLGIQRGLNLEYDGLSTYMAAQQTEYAQARISSAEFNALKNKNAALAGAFSAIDSYGELDFALFQGIYLAADRCSVSIEDFAFDRALGRLELTCLGPGVSSATGYIRELEALEHVSGAEYSGYELASASSRQEDQPLYRFDITCLVAGEGEIND